MLFLWTFYNVFWLCVFGTESEEWVFSTLESGEGSNLTLSIWHQIVVLYVFSSVFLYNNCEFWCVDGFGHVVYSFARVVCKVVRVVMGFQTTLLQSWILSSLDLDIKTTNTVVIFQR
jgi:hypothetical protein